MQKEKQFFKNFYKLLYNLPQQDKFFLKSAIAHQKKLLKPVGSLGRLEEIAIWLAGWKKKLKPLINQPLVIIFAANHGIVKQGVTPFHQKFTEKMIDNFKSGKAAINQICISNNLDLKVYDLDINNPTMDFSEKPAMDMSTCISNIKTGMRTVTKKNDLICLGDMGIGNTTSAATLALGLFGGNVKDWTGKGSGSLGKLFQKKVEIVEKSINLHSRYFINPIEVLRRVGGYEFAAIVGAIISARIKRIPVVLDGFSVTAAASVLFKINPESLDHCIVGHCSSEKGHYTLLKKIKKKPLLNFKMRLGEGTGAALAVNVIRSSAFCHANMGFLNE